MGTVVDLDSRRRARRSARRSAATPGQFVTCTHCNERHPVIRMVDGTHQCLTAFNDGPDWFCQNRGCRAAWLSEKDA